MISYICRLISFTLSRDKRTSKQDLQAKKYIINLINSINNYEIFFIYVSNCLELDDLCQMPFYRRLSHSNKERGQGSDQRVFKLQLNHQM